MNFLRDYLIKVSLAYIPLRYVRQGHATSAYTRQPLLSTHIVSLILPHIAS